MGTSAAVRPPSSVPQLQVRTPDGRVFRFATTFHVGREHDCELRVQDANVSRKHLEVSFRDGRWRIRDLKSANGLFVDGQRVETVVIQGATTVTLGIDGPSLIFDPDPQVRGRTTPEVAAATIQTPASETKLLAEYQERYFGPGAPRGEVGGRTMMIRKAFENVQRKQRRRFIVVVAALGLALLGVAGYAFYKQQQVQKQQAIAVALFYDMKALDVSIARIEQSLAVSGDASMQAEIRSMREQRRQAESRYDSYLKVLNLYDQKLSPEDRLILRVTRRFGECELAAPTAYMKQVRSYIQEWRSTDRYARAIATATRMNYTPTIAKEFIERNLPPHFFYLALQESDFDPLVSGPPTRMGYAKGMWQFIPDTAVRFGLTIGPLAAFPRADPRDDRHDWQKATRAAARYIKDIYTTDAQASGLLVIASYNWGENRVINLVRSLPTAPAERNFWKLIERYSDRVPGETYDYVFRIVSAAVIGEDPRSFGFAFDNPLASVDTR